MGDTTIFPKDFKLGKKFDKDEDIKRQLSFIRAGIEIMIDRLTNLEKQDVKSSNRK